MSITFLNVWASATGRGWGGSNSLVGNLPPTPSKNFEFALDVNAL